MSKRVGSIIHGALGDCYEQLVCLQKFKEENSCVTLIGFFAVENRHRAFLHYDLSLFDELYSRDMIGNIPVDEYYQFQINDDELQENIIKKLASVELNKFDLKKNVLPWKILRKHDYVVSPLTLKLSDRGLEYLKFVKNIHKIVDNNNMKVGFLWRYRKDGINSFGQYPKNIIKRNISEILNYYQKYYEAHIYVCGMGAGKLQNIDCYQKVLDEGGIAVGEHKYKFDEALLDIDGRNATYLMGTGYAAEMEIMSQCDLIITMPSGFSEPLWMKNPKKVVMVFSPLEYLIKLWKHRMPFFDNTTLKGKIFNSFTY